MIAGVRANNAGRLLSPFSAVNLTGRAPMRLDAGQMMSRLLIHGVFLACMVVCAARPVLAFGVDAYIAVVNAFTHDLESAMESGVSGRLQRAEAAYWQYFDIAGIAEKTAPPEIWAAAGSRQKLTLQAFVACRMARETMRRRNREKPEDWAVAGTRTTTKGVTVALRFTLTDQRAQTLQFDLVSRGRRILVSDLRSERGRLTARLAEDVRRQTATLAGTVNVDRWLEKLKCGQ